MDKFMPPGLNQATGNGPRPPSPFDAASSVLASAQTLARRVEALADHLLGGVSQEAINGATTGQPVSGCLYRMAEQAYYTDKCIAEANAALDRIEAVLP